MLPLLLDWLEQAKGARLLGFLPTMDKRAAATRASGWASLERLAAAEQGPVAASGRPAPRPVSLQALSLRAGMDAVCAA